MNGVVHFRSYKKVKVRFKVKKYGRDIGIGEDIGKCRGIISVNYRGQGKHKYRGRDRGQYKGRRSGKCICSDRGEVMVNFKVRGRGQVKCIVIN